ncbi:uncharacterized protein TRUGW13939_08036 [Talaromyces rugulosus]|uniref:Uncharacterized protein n=1 Tax=Talaromyces rugulosus TaxID=121627 RepID=A0A7H8R3C4_TALRU|nr:uncharacterized protein TRUGW13939_08036 [Talaromyces rugulosus]QKX60890.1 hypothetical protein TRUGW13939_08036 [Talaromyces rugulosus]
MMQASSLMIHAAPDEERKKRNRIAKRKSRQRQAQQALANETQDGLGSVTFSGDMLLPVLADKHVDPTCMGEGYALDPALYEPSVLECLGYTSEEPVTQIRAGSIDPQLAANHRDAPRPSAPGGDLESAIARWASSTPEFPFQLPQKQEQQSHSSRREPALHRAVITGNEDIVKVLLQHQADVDSRDKNGRTALDLAIDAGHVAIVQILLAHGADIEGN